MLLLLKQGCKENKTETRHCVINLCKYSFDYNSQLCITHEAPIIHVKNSYHQ